MALLRNPGPICPLCGNAVELKTCNTDSNGASVHEDCYVAEIAAKRREERQTG